VIEVVVDDVAFVAADAIVRPATASLEPTTPMLSRLEQVGGAAFREQLQVIQELAVGSAVVTGGGDLPAEFVIHAIISSTTEPVSLAGVRRALVSSIQRAADWQLVHLSLPPLGTGAGNLDLEDAAHAMLGVLGEAMDRSPYPERVTIVVENAGEKEVFEGFMQRFFP
jgi:O-acetyl-ADP-ribose deacetylase (regulator of RNase III)